MKERKCAVLVKLPAGDTVYWNCEMKTSAGDTVFCGKQSGIVLAIFDWLDIQDFPCVDAVYDPYEDAEYDPRAFVIEDDVLLKYRGKEACVQVPSCVKYIGEYAFDGNFEVIDLPGSVERVNGYAFTWRTHIGALIIHGDTAFEQSVALQDRPFPCNEKDGCLYLGCAEHPYLALMDIGDATLPEIVLHPECRSISEGAFDNASAAKRIVIPDSVTRIARNALMFGSKTKTLEIGAGLPISEDTFSEIRRTVNVVVSPQNPTVKQVGKNIFSADGKTLLFGACGPVPKEVVAIGRRAFIEARRLKEIELPEGVESIGEYAFGNADLTSVNLPSTLQHVDYTAFCGTKKLVTPIRYRGTRAEWKAIIAENSIEKEIFCELEPDPFLARVTAYTITVKFHNRKKQRYNCDFAVQVGDRVRVPGRHKNAIGTVVQIIENRWTNHFPQSIIIEVIR